MDEKTMLLSQLLKADRLSFSPESCRDVLGDAYLLKHNVIYRRLRRAVVARGYSLVCAWPEYTAFSLSQLENVLARREIPVIFNRNVLEQIERRTLSRMRVGDLPASMSSFHLHESAHGVADELCAELPEGSKRARVLRKLMGESFANACESLASALAHNEEHRAFLQINCYMKDSVNSRKLKNRLIRTIGLRQTFYLAFYSYLYANFLFASFSPNLAAQILEDHMPGHGLSRGILNDCVRFMEIGLELNTGFRVQTNQFYFSCNGCKGDLLKMLDFDFYDIIRRRDVYRDAVEDMADVIEHGESTECL